MVYKEVFIIYTVKEVAEEFKVTERTVRRWIEEGKIKRAINIGAVRIPTEEVLKLREVK